MSNIYEKAIKNNETLKAQVLTILKRKQQSCYDLEDGLDRAHQSVSATIKRLRNEGLVEIADKTSVNKYGNVVRVYKAVKSV